MATLRVIIILIFIVTAIYNLFSILIFCLGYQYRSQFLDGADESYKRSLKVSIESRGLINRAAISNISRGSSRGPLSESDGLAIDVEVGEDRA